MDDEDESGWSHQMDAHSNFDLTWNSTAVESNVIYYFLINYPYLKRMRKQEIIEKVFFYL